MKLVQLECPRCGKGFNAFAERQTVVCSNCGQKSTRGIGKLYECAYIDMTELEKVKKIILDGRPEEYVDTCKEMLDERETDPYIWLLRGFIQICTYDMKGERVAPALALRRAFMSWKKAVLQLCNDNLFDDFVRLMGASFARRDMLGIGQAQYLGPEAENFAAVADKTMRFDSKIVIWHLFYEGYSDCMFFRDDPTDGDDACFKVIARNCVFYETDYICLIDECLRMAVMSDKRHGKDGNLLRLIADTCKERSKGLTMEDRSRIMSKWDSRTLELNLTDAWNDVLKANGEELPDLFAPFSTRGQRKMTLEQAVDEVVTIFLNPHWNKEAGGGFRPQDHF